MRLKLAEFEQDLLMDEEPGLVIIDDIRSNLKGRTPKTQPRFQPVIGLRFQKN